MPSNPRLRIPEPVQFHARGARFRVMRTGPSGPSLPPVCVIVAGADFGLQTYLTPGEAIVFGRALLEHGEFARPLALERAQDCAE